MPQRTLSEEEFEAVKARVLAAAPDTIRDEADFTRWVGPAMAQALGEAENLPAAASGSATGRFLANAGAIVNPIAIAQGVAGALRHPVETLSQIGEASASQAQQALQAGREGRYLEAIGHGLGTIPIVGPAAVAAGEQIASGDIAGGLGTSTGLLLPTAVPAAIRGVRAAVQTLPASVATRAEAGATQRLVNVMTPKVGANKTRFGTMAERVAPAIAKDLAAEGAPLTREGLHASISAKLGQAEEALDAATAARNSQLVYHTKPIVTALRAKVQALTASTVRREGLKAGADVLPGPNVARAKALTGAIDEVERLGPVASYESLRRIRQAYDGPAKAVYTPSLTADFLTAQGGKLGAADVTGVHRESLAKFDPQTAAANARYALYKTVDDVLEATREVERARPRVGRQILARLTGTIAGGQAAGLPGAVTGYIFAPALDAALSSGLTMQLKTAAALTKLAQAIRGGDVGAVTSLASQMRRLGVTAAAIRGQATTPSESPTRTTAAGSSAP